MIESVEDLLSKILLITTVQQSNAELKDILTKILQELQNSRIESNSKITELKNLRMTSLKEVSSAITENMTSFFNHQKKLNSFNKRLEKSRKHFGSIWKNSLNTRKQSFWCHYKSSRFFLIYNDLLQHEPPKMARKLQPKFIPNEAPEDTKIRKDLAVEKFKSEIKLLQTPAERYKQRISKLDCGMMEYLQTDFDEDIVAELS